MRRLSYRQWQSPVGVLHLGASPEKILFVAYEDNVAAVVKSLKAELVEEETAVLTFALQELESYFRGDLRRFTVPYELHGTDFQKKVWSVLENIPYGQIVSYSQQAEKLQQPQAVRAVSTANTRNPLAILVPHHRVLTSAWAATGYAGGCHIKRHLLSLEGAVVLPARS